MKIFVDRKVLTDKSAVYNVRLTRFEDMPRSIDTMTFGAESREAAESMAREIEGAINMYSTEIAAFQGMPE